MITVDLGSRPDQGKEGEGGGKWVFALRPRLYPRLHDQHETLRQNTSGKKMFVCEKVIRISQDVSACVVYMYDTLEHKCNKTLCTCLFL